MRVLLIALLFVFSAHAQSNTWYLVRGNISTDDSWGVDVDTSGNIYWTTVHKNPPPYGFYDIYLYKIAPDSQQLWRSEPYGKNFNDVGFPVRVWDTCVFVAGRTDSNIVQTKADPLVLCYSKQTGKLLWDYIYVPDPNYGYEEIDGLSIQSDGIYFTGWTRDEQLIDGNIIIQKITHSGQLAWNTTWDYENLKRHDGANGHLVMDDKYLYVAAHVNKANPIASNDGDAALVCFNRSDGSHAWHTLWGGNSWDHGLGLTMSTDSMLYMVGHTGSYGNLQQFFINKYDRSGQLKWSRMWGGTGAELSRAVVPDGDSIIYATGTTTSYKNGDYDIFVLKYDSSGNVLDSLFWGGSGKEEAHDLAIYKGFLYIVGFTESIHANPEDSATDAFLLKVNGRTMEAPAIPTSANRHALAQTSQYGIYPKLANNYLLIRRQNDNAIGKCKICITDCKGKKMTSLSLNRQVEKIDLRSLASGVYLVRTEEKNAVSVQKLIINKQ